MIYSTLLHSTPLYSTSFNLIGIYNILFEIKGVVIDLRTNVRVARYPTNSNPILSTPEWVREWVSISEWEWVWEWVSELVSEWVIVSEFEWVWAPLMSDYD